ncbi:MAG: TonB-dependent receptor [Chitinophagaceae bacterium]|nr:TonB-dependent receptor [Chitinophagaceae bacterium]MCW5928980.1 TonB-dependent receptor [Chitinophagaceae bacterium]
MKLTTVFIIVACLQVSARVYSQRVTLSGNNIPIQKVFEEIRKQTGYQFFYADKTIQSANTVSLHLKNVPLEQALNVIFENQPLTFNISENTIIVKKRSIVTPPAAKFVLAAEPPTDMQVRGKVTDEKGQSLEGATVLIKGTDKGVKTDAGGNFTIETTPNAILVISYVGFETAEVKVSGSTILIQLKSSINTSDQILVVGYGSQRKSDITGAVSKVDIDKAKAIPTTNIAEMIRGQAAGVQVTLLSARPGGNSNILIRGKKSIRGLNDPLIVLDGFPIENINDVNPDDIASIEILKDASAQAIYGARASNGVILITTHKGKTGRMRVTVNSYLTTHKLTKNFDLYTAEEFAELRREAVRTQFGSYQTDDVNFQGLEGDNFSKGRFVNWEDEVLQSGLISSNTISVMGGTENTKLFTSANYFTQRGLIPTADYQRGAFRINIDQKINSRANIEANLNFATDKQRKETNNLDFITISPFTGPYDSTGALIKLVAGANASSSTLNPLWNIRESDNDTKTNLLNLNLVLNYKLSKNFSYKLNTLLSRRNVDEGIYLTKEHSVGLPLNGSATVSNTLREEYLIENILNYEEQINANNKIDITLVQSLNQRNTSRTTSTGTGFGSDVLGYDGISNALIFKTNRGEEQYRLASFLGRLRYNLMDKYLLSFTARKDGASVFAESRKWGFFPAASFAWQMHKEKFVQGIEAINQLKLRFSYGTVGNQSLDPYATLGVVGNTPYVFGPAIVAGALPGTVLPNPSLTWETSTTFNAGIDFGLLNNHLTGTIEYYDTRTTDLLTDITLGGTSGFSSMITNGGKSQNRGIEVLLTGHIIRNTNWSWSVTTAFTTNKNRILKTGIVDIEGNPKDDIARNRFVGQPIDVIRTMMFDGIFQTDDEAIASAQGTLGGTVTPFTPLTVLKAGSIRIKDVNGDGRITDADNVIISQNPDWFGSVSTTLAYKNFELLADFYIVQGATKRNPYLGDFNQGGTLQSYRNGIKVNYWTPENPSTTHPRPNYASGQAPPHTGLLTISDASYTRLRTLSLGYNVPPSVLGRVKMSSLRVYITANNLVTVTNYKSYSPENNPNDFPDTKGFTFGVNVGF